MPRSTPAKMRSSRARTGLKLLIACFVLTSSFCLATEALAKKPGPSCRSGDSIVVEPAGTPAADKQAIQTGIDLGQAMGKCVRLEGQFFVGLCTYCIKITAPVTVTGQADPTGANPREADLTVVTALGGFGLLAVDLPADSPTGDVRVSDIWWRGANNSTLTVLNSRGGTIEFSRNRITRGQQFAGFRFGILAAAALPGSESLRGSLIVTDNYIDNTDVAFPLGDDNGVALQGASYDTFVATGNTVITNGEGIEIEGGTGTDYEVVDNYVVTQRTTPSVLAIIVDIPGFPGLHGGHPAVVKMAGIDVRRMRVEDNVITTGSSPTAVCMMHHMADPAVSIHRKRSYEIKGNTCVMDGNFAGLLGGWAGSQPVFPKGSLDDAIVRKNVFVGTGVFGISMMDFVFPAAPQNDLVNTSNNVKMHDNDLSKFTPSEASLYLGPSTFGNVFSGFVNGPVVDLGMNNRIQIKNPPVAGTQNCRNPIDVTATGVTFRDQRNIQAGINAGQAALRCVRLEGQFSVGLCVRCLKITAPVTLLGQADPTGPATNPADVTVVKALGGLGLLEVDKKADATGGRVEVRDIWWQGSDLSAISVSNFHDGELRFIRNRITDIRSRVGQRFGLTSSCVVGDCFVGGSHVLIDSNYIDIFSGFVPVLLGDDNGIAFIGSQFDEVDIVNNFHLSRGELEYELASGSTLNISNNTITTIKEFDTASVLDFVEVVGFPNLRTGLPISMAMRGNDFETTKILNNDIWTGGGTKNAVSILLDYPVNSIHPKRTADIVGNNIHTEDTFAAIQMGFVQVTQFLPEGIADFTDIKRNTFTGTASFGIVAPDLRFRLPGERPSDLMNTSNNNVIRQNSFSGFTPSEATLYLGPSTFDNTFEGDPNGPVIDLGTNNRIKTRN